MYYVLCRHHLLSNLRSTRQFTWPGRLRSVVDCGVWLLGGIFTDGCVHIQERRHGTREQYEKEYVEVYTIIGVHGGVQGA